MLTPALSCKICETLLAEQRSRSLLYGRLSGCNLPDSFYFLVLEIQFSCKKGNKKEFYHTIVNTEYEHCQADDPHLNGLVVEMLSLEQSQR